MSQHEIILIAHRGNINGPNPAKENSPLYVQDALDKGFDVEVDVHYVSGEWFLGHDKPKYNVNQSWLEREHIWCHAKDIYTLHMMLMYPAINCFWHQDDDCALTSYGYIWAFPINTIGPKCICVFNRIVNSYIPLNCGGVCADDVILLRKILKGMQDAECSNTDGGFR